MALNSLILSFQKWQLGTVFLPDSFGYLIGTNCFALIALKLGRHRLAIVAMLSVGISAISVINISWKVENQ